MSESNPCTYNRIQSHYTKSTRVVVAIVVVVIIVIIIITVCNNALNYIEITIAKELRSEQYQLDRL